MNNHNPMLTPRSTSASIDLNDQRVLVTANAKTLGKKSKKVSGIVGCTPIHSPVTSYSKKKVTIVGDDGKSATLSMENFCVMVVDAAASLNLKIHETTNYPA